MGACIATDGANTRALEVLTDRPYRVHEKRFLEGWSPTTGPPRDSNLNDDQARSVNIGVSPNMGDRKGQT